MGGEETTRWEQVFNEIGRKNTSSFSSFPAAAARPHAMGGSLDRSPFLVVYRDCSSWLESLIVAAVKTSPSLTHSVNSERIVWYSYLNSQHTTLPNSGRYSELPAKSQSTCDSLFVLVGHTFRHVFIYFIWLAMSGSIGGLQSSAVRNGVTRDQIENSRIKWYARSLLCSVIRFRTEGRELNWIDWIQNGIGGNSINDPFFKFLVRAFLSSRWSLEVVAQRKWTIRRRAYNLSLKTLIVNVSLFARSGGIKWQS